MVGSCFLGCDFGRFCFWVLWGGGDCDVNNCFANVCFAQGLLCCLNEKTYCSVGFYRCVEGGCFVVLFERK